MVELHLLGGPYVTRSGTRVSLPEGGKKLVALIALNERRVERARAARVLWPDADAPRAAGNLRSAIWRLRCAGVDILRMEKDVICLDPELEVDLDEIASWADRLVGGRADLSDLECQPLAIEALDLLPGWYDDWVTQEREDLRQRMLRAFEALAQRLVKANRCVEAIEAALAAVSMEPLRETAQTILVQAHLAEGNRWEALRSYTTYEHILGRELGVYPSAELRQLLV